MSITPIVDVYYTHSRCHLLWMQWNCKDSSVKQKKKIISMTAICMLYELNSKSCYKQLQQKINSNANFQIHSDAIFGHPSLNLSHFNSLL